MKTSCLCENGISVVVPVYDEEENIQSFYAAIKEAVDKLEVEYEIIFIDDGSIDESFEILKKIAAGDDSMKIIRFARNFGQTAAIDAGFKNAAGDVVITLDADMQNDPEDISRLLDKLEEGYDVVSGWRKQRKDSLILKRIPSFFANKIAVAMTGVKLHDFGCTLKAYRKDIIKDIQLYGEMHRFIPALASWRGAKMAEIVVEHHPRKHGKSKYGLERIIKVILDLITINFLGNYFAKPIHMFGSIGLFLSGGGGLLAIILVVYKIFHRMSLLDNATTRGYLYLAILATALGVQLITLGLLSEILVRTYYESQGKTTYFIREVISGKENKGE